MVSAMAFTLAVLAITYHVYRVSSLYAVGSSVYSWTCAERILEYLRQSGEFPKGVITYRVIAIKHAEQGVARGEYLAYTYGILPNGTLIYIEATGFCKP